MLAADGILLGTPVYFGDANATMRGLIERAGYATRKNGNPLARKVGAAVVAVRRGGAMHAFDSVNHFFQIAEMIVVGSSYWNFGIGRRDRRRRRRRRGPADHARSRTQHGLGARQAERLKTPGKRHATRNGELRVTADGERRGARAQERAPHRSPPQAAMRLAGSAAPASV